MWRHTFSLLNFHFNENLTILKDFLNVGTNILSQALKVGLSSASPILVRLWITVHVIHLLEFLTAKQREWAFLTDIWKIREIDLPDWMNGCWKCLIWSFVQSFANIGLWRLPNLKFSWNFHFSWWWRIEQQLSTKIRN